MKRFLKCLAACSILGTTAVSMGVWLVEYEKPCRQPCSAPGQAQESGATGVDVGERRPACQLVGLRLEVAEPEAKAGRRATLFLRVTMENRSCLQLTLDAAGLIWPYGRSLTNSYRLRVVSPDGATVKRTSRQEGVVFFEDEPGALKRFKDRTGLVVTDNGHVITPPGREFSSMGTVLRPHRSALCDMTSEKFGWDGSGSCFVYDIPVPKGMQEPPQGFTGDDGYVFTKPGKYTAQIEFDQHGVVSRPVRPYAHFVPLPVREVLFHADLTKPRSYTEYHVHAESNIVTFEVKP